MHDHDHPGGHTAGHTHPHAELEARPPSQPSKAVVLDVGADAGALILRSSAQREGLEVEIHPADAPECRTHVWVLPREGSGGSIVYAAVFPRLSPGDYAVLEPDGRVGRTVAVPASCVTYADWVDGA